MILRTRSRLGPLFLATLSVAAAALAEPVAPSDSATRGLAPGLEYRHEQREGPLSIHIVKLDLASDDLAVRVKLASGAVLDRQTVRGVAESIPAAEGKPLVAVNGDYFEMAKTGNPRYQGTLEGIHIAAGELVHTPLGNVFWFDRGGRPHLDTGVGSEFSLTWPDGTRMGFGLNCSTTAHKSEVGAADVVLYTPTFGTSTRTEGGLELELARSENSEWLPLRAGHTYTAEITSISRKGDTAIGRDGMVLSIVESVADRLPPVKVGDRVRFTTGLKPDLRDAVEAIGGGPPLLVNGQQHPTAVERENRHPRTAIGFNATHLFVVVVDGRQPRLSVGMSYGELVDLMAGLGCTDALNLDGGGSSTMWLDGNVVNSPSDAAGERAVGNAVVILRKPAAQ